MAAYWGTWMAALTPGMTLIGITACVAFLTVLLVVERWLRGRVGLDG